MKKSVLLAAFISGFVCFGASAQDAKPAAGTKTEQGDPSELKNISMPKKLIPITEHYPGGQDAMYRYLDSQIKYPLLARRNRIQGECIIGVVLNEDGTLSNFKVLTNKGGNLGEEALRVIKTLKFNPSEYRNQYSIPIYFKL